MMIDSRTGHETTIRKLYEHEGNRKLVAACLAGPGRDFNATYNHAFMARGLNGTILVSLTKWNQYYHQRGSDYQHMRSEVVSTKLLRFNPKEGTLVELLSGMTGHSRTADFFGPMTQDSNGNIYLLNYGGVDGPASEWTRSGVQGLDSIPSVSRLQLFNPGRTGLVNVAFAMSDSIRLDHIAVDSSDRLAASASRVNREDIGLYDGVLVRLTPKNGNPTHHELAILLERQSFGDVAPDVAGNIALLPGYWYENTSGKIVRDFEPPEKFGQLHSLSVDITDTDGDGLLETWETHGIDVDDDGKPELDLPGLYKTDPRHKDLFVEVDAIGTWGPAAYPDVAASLKPHLRTNTSLDIVIGSFAKAPNELVRNPDGKDGVDLHVIIDETGLAAGGDWTTLDAWGWPKPLAAITRDHFGLRNGKPTPDQNTLLAHEMVFRYCVFAEESSKNGRDGVSGLVSTVLIVSLKAAWNGKGLGFGWFNTLYDWTGGAVGNPERRMWAGMQASTFMHELGHTLGLKHGGNDDWNWKPNYVSVMNNRWKYMKLPDYSRVELDPKEVQPGDPCLTWEPPELRCKLGLNSGFEDWSHLKYSFLDSPNFVRNEPGLSWDQIVKLFEMYSGLERTGFVPPVSSVLSEVVPLLESAYRQVLERAADPAGLAHFKSVLETGRNQVFSQMSLKFVASAEGRGKAIESFYTRLFERKPGAAEVQGWVRRVEQGMSLEQLVATLAASAEYYQRTGSTAGGWLDGVYRDLLGRARDGGAAGFLAAATTASGRETVARTLLGSAEFRGRLVASTYSGILGRTAGPAETTTWVNFLSQSAPPVGQPHLWEQFVARLLGSTEFINRNAGNAASWLGNMYRLVLNREASPVELDAMHTAVLNGYESARREVLTVLVSSAEARGRRVADAYRTLLRRGASETELQGWVMFLRNGGTDAQMVTAMVSSAEYFQRHGNDNSRWLDGIFADLLGRAREAATKPMADALNTGAPRATFVALVVQSLEYGKRQASKYIGQYLGRAALPQERDTHGQALARDGRAEDVIAALLASAEFFNRTQVRQ